MFIYMSHLRKCAHNGADAVTPKSLGIIFFFLIISQFYIVLIFHNISQFLAYFGCL